MLHDSLYCSSEILLTSDEVKISTLNSLISENEKMNSVVKSIWLSDYRDTEKYKRAFSGCEGAKQENILDLWIWFQSEILSEI